MPQIAQLPLGMAIMLFLGAAAAIAVAGVRMAANADRLADRTGIGEALFGGLLLGGGTSIPGIVTSVTASLGGHTELAMTNAIGGIAVQTFFLAIADIVYRRANLEHAAASLTNLTLAAVLISLLCLPLAAWTMPRFALAGIHPVSILILGGYLFGMRVAGAAQADPMWGPRRTYETRTDEPQEPAGGRRTIVRLFLNFGGLALILGIAGYVTAESGVSIAVKTGLGETVVGALFTGVSTSMPELVTTIAAIRRGALTLAMGGIFGGNMFDMLFIAAADIAYRQGSIYHTVSARPYFLMALSILMTVVLLLGMLRRERHGIANIGFESAIVLVLYLGGVAAIVVSGIG